MCYALKYGIWNVKEPKMDAVNNLVSGGYAPLVAMILASRGIQTAAQARAMLDCNGPLLDPFLMTDMDLAAGRVGIAMARGEKIANMVIWVCEYHFASTKPSPRGEGGSSRSPARDETDEVEVAPSERHRTRRNVATSSVTALAGDAP